MTLIPTICLLLFNFCVFLLNVMPVKSELPNKICPVCSRPFSWRKKWERHWDSVRYCSQRCRRSKNRAQGVGNPPISSNTRKPWKQLYTGFAMICALKTTSHWQGRAKVNGLFVYTVLIPGILKMTFMVFHVPESSGRNFFWKPFPHWNKHWVPCTYHCLFPWIFRKKPFQHLSNALGLLKSTLKKSGRGMRGKWRNPCSKPYLKRQRYLGIMTSFSFIPVIFPFQISPRSPGYLHFLERTVKKPYQCRSANKFTTNDQHRDG